MFTDGPLIGRESELAELEGMMNGARALTVTGAGGCGKTLLALTLARRVACAERESAVVALSGIAGEQQLIDALLAALGGRERFGRTPTQVLIERLASRRLLLILDNCEHLLAEVGRLTAVLLDGAPEVQVLMTSRAPLQIDGESVMRLGPLSLPAGGDIGAVVRSDAARLFVDRAARSDPAFALTPSTARAVADICHELDGLPLALVLAAARLDTLSAEEIAESLSRGGRLAAASGEQELSRRGDELSQHTSLRASLDWSYGLLDERERALLRRLSVFREGFTTTSAHAVAAPDTDPKRVHADLGALEAKGLLARVSGKAQERSGQAQERWMLLQTVAEYAAEQLAHEAEDAAIADRHLTWFRAWAEHADTLLLEPDGHARIERETPNLRRALDRAIEHDRSGALEIAASLMRHWILAEHYQEAGSVTAAILAIATVDMSVDGDGAGSEDGAGGRDGVGDEDGIRDEDGVGHAIGDGDDAIGDEDAAARAVVHCGAGLVAMLSEDYTGAIESTRAGLELLGEVQEAGARSTCLQLSSMVLIQTGLDPNEGLRNAERAVEPQRSIEDPLGLAFALVNLAVAAMLCERFDLLDTAYGEFLTIPQACEHARLRTWAEQAAAWAQVTTGSPERALQHADRGLALEGEWPSMTHFQVLSFRIHALARLGRIDQALGEGAEAMRRAQESGALQAVPAIELALMVAQLMDGDPDAAAIRARRLLQMPHLHTLALAREMLARIALMRGDAGEAQTHARELDAIARRSGSPRHDALAHYIAGRAAIEARQTDRGRDLLHAALQRYAELGLEREAADVLDELALLAAGAGEGPRAARLAAAAAQARARLGCAPWPEIRERLDAARAKLPAGERDGSWEAAWEQGQALSLTDAIAYARRSRGRRDRPPAGWASLTPAELDVAQLAGSGISNPEIAARLFIARGTVKMHLSSAYRKLDVANRTELAAAIATHTDPRASTIQTVRSSRVP
jgi:predicted ATPase/DNA-binding CsgD family transcriptional regulator